MVERLTALVAGVCLAVYWGTVMVKGYRLSRKIGKDPNFVPRERTGQYMRLLWAPTVMAWCAQPWVAIALAGRAKPWFLRYVSEHSDLGRSLLCILGAAVSAVALWLTFYCWRQMGRSWRIGIDPNEKTELIRNGAYRYVRHPIYALSILLMLGTLAVLPTPLMLLTAVIHITMLQVEARREEQYLIGKHGDGYRSYQQATGRFIPRLKAG